MFVTKKKLNKIVIEIVRNCYQKDIECLEKEVLGNFGFPYYIISHIPESKVARNTRKIEKYTAMLTALVNHLKLKFEESPRYGVGIVDKKEKNHE